MRTASLAAICFLTVTATAIADPCGMVPPVYVGDDIPIARVGEQKTYVFVKDGVETVVIRPGFEGKVAEFGMLIPFPAIPDLRKVSDNIFAQIAAAVDPPEVVIYVRNQLLITRLSRFERTKRKSSTRGFAAAVGQVQ